MKSTITITKIKNYSLKLIKNNYKSEIFLDDELIWNDYVDNHINSKDKIQCFEEYTLHCFSELSNLENIEVFGKHIESTDTAKILSSMGYALTFHFCSEGNLNEGLYMDELENY